jgi:hypothetical protein
MYFPLGEIAMTKSSRDIAAAFQRQTCIRRPKLTDESISELPKIQSRRFNPRTC